MVINAIAKDRCITPDRLQRLIRGDLDWLVMKALDKDRARRYTTPTELASDIQRYLQDEAVEARPPSTGYRLRKLATKNKPRRVA